MDYSTSDMSSSATNHGSSYSYVPKLQAPSTGSPKHEQYSYNNENNFYNSSTTAFGGSTDKNQDYGYSGNYGYSDSQYGQTTNNTDYFGTHHNAAGDHEADADE